MATILLSIKPEYANKIFDGQKHYEYRKRIPKKEVSKIVVYSSAPEQAVIGEFDVVKTLKMKPTPLWNSTKANAGISRSKYRKYFSGCTTAYAFVIGSFKKYPTSKSLADLNSVCTSIICIFRRLILLRWGTDRLAGALFLYESPISQ